VVDARAEEGRLVKEVARVKAEAVVATAKLREEQALSKVR
jgi:hypothetical protein